MLKNFLIIIVFLFVVNCNLNKVEKTHGTPFLEKKEKILILNKTNKNDILKELGAPSTKSFFDKDVWIYIERKTTNSSLIKLGKKRSLINNVLVLEIDKRGLLSSKKIYTIEDVNNLEFSEKKTLNTDKDTFVKGVLTSLRQKIDSPKRRKNNSKKQ